MLALLRARRPVCVHALGDADCGPASLASICQYHGLPVTLQRARALVAADLLGIDIHGLVDGATAAGLEATAGKVENYDLSDLPLPAIFHLKDTTEGHYVVVYKVMARMVLVADPSHDLMKISRAELYERWSGHVVLLRPRADFVAKRAWTSPPAVRMLARQAFASWKSLLTIVALSVVAIATGVSLSWCLRSVMDTIIPEGSSGILTTCAVATLAASVVKAISSYVKQRLVASVAYRLDVEHTGELLKKLLPLPLWFFSRQMIGSLYQRITDVTRVRGALTHTIPDIVSDLICACVYVGLLAVTNVKVAVIATVLAGISVWCGRLQAQACLSFERRAQALANVSSSTILDTLSSIRTIKAYRAERLSVSKLVAHFSAATAVLRDKSVKNNGIAAAITLFGAASSVLILWLTIRMALAHQMTLGEAIYEQMIAGLLLGVSERLAPSLLTVAETLLSVDRVAEIETVGVERPDANCTIPYAAGGIRFDINNVSFWYRKKQWVLKNVSATFDSNEFVVILGATGCGKSTLSALLAGLYEPQDGYIAVDGVRAAEIDIASHRHNVVIVFQDTQLIAASVYENLALGYEATMKEVELAARQADAHEFICNLPGGYQCSIGSRGTALSSGQKQRIAIARALVRKPRALLLDEATSNLDLATEQRVLKAIRASYEKRTIVMITHRVATARIADRIIVMEGGQIAEIGNHENLAHAGGLYEQMWRLNDDVQDSHIAIAS